MSTRWWGNSGVFRYASTTPELIRLIMGWVAIVVGSVMVIVYGLNGGRWLLGGVGVGVLFIGSLVYLGPGSAVHKSRRRRRDETT